MSFDKQFALFHRLTFCDAPLSTPLVHVRLALAVGLEGGQDDTDDVLAVARDQVAYSIVPGHKTQALNAGIHHIGGGLDRGYIVVG